MLTKILTGHTSFETAYIVNDYPYGFRLRCKMAYWLETNPKHGVRLMSRTTNPKKAGEVWNKPKASTYSALKVMGLNEIGHVVTHSLSMASEVETVAAYETLYGAVLTSDYEVKTLKIAKILAAKFKKMFATAEVVTA